MALITSMRSNLPLLGVTKKEKKIQEVLDVFDGVERLSDDDVCHGQLHQLPPTGHLRSNALPLPCPHGCDQTQNPVEKKHIEDHSFFRYGWGACLNSGAISYAFSNSARDSASFPF